MAIDIIQHTNVIEEINTNTTIAPRWKILLHNDDYHTMEFIIMMIQKVFRKNMSDALQHTLEIHTKGVTVATVCSKERAELYLEQVSSIHEDRLGPLQCTMEEEI